MAYVTMRFAANYAVVRSALTVSLAAKPSREQVLALAARSAAMPINDDTVSMTGPVAATKYTDRNTSVTLTAKPGSGYKGSIELHYSRIPLSKYFPDPRWLLPATATETTIHALLPAINAAYGVNLSTAEIADAPVPANATTVTLEALAGSYVFQEGSRFAFATPLANVVTKRQTKGFYPNNPYEDQTIFDLMFEPTQSGTMLIDRKANYAFTRYTGTGAVEVDPADGLQGLNLKGNGLFQAPYDATTMNPNAQDFTIEARIKVPSITPQRFPIFNRLVTSSTSGSFAFGLVQGKLDFLWTTNGTNSTSRRVTAAAALQPNREYDVSVSRNGSVIRIYVDGVLVGTATSVTTIWVGPSNLFIGGDTGSSGATTYAGTGWIKALRYTLGVGRYPEAYSPKNIPLISRVLTRKMDGFSPKDQAQILLQFKGNYENSGPLPMTPAVASSISIVDGAGKFSGGGLRNAGTVNLGALTYACDFALDDHYTVEWFQRKVTPSTNVASVNQVMWVLEGANGGTVAIQYYSSSFYIYDVNGTTVATIPAPWPANADHQHIALSVNKEDNVCRVFFNGVLLGQFTSANMTPLAKMTRLRLTNLGTVNVPLTAFYLSEFAITKGRAKYTANFTPPSAPLI